MDLQISNLQKNFNSIKENREGIDTIFDQLSQRIQKLKVYYEEFITRNNGQSMLVFGLDSFHFQHKLINFEFDNMRKFFRLVNNRMYGDYYKLLKIMKEFIVTKVNDPMLVDAIPNTTNPVYKDLQPYREYLLSDLFDIHKQIISLLISLNSYLVTREHDLSNYQGKSNIGLNIDNFVTSYRHANRTITDQTSLYIDYVEVFHNLHTGYLTRFKSKIEMMYTQINKDVSFEPTVSPSSSPQPNQKQTTVKSKAKFNPKQSLILPGQENTSSLLSSPAISESSSRESQLVPLSSSPMPPPKIAIDGNDRDDNENKNRDDNEDKNRDDSENDNEDSESISQNTNNSQQEENNNE